MIMPLNLSMKGGKQKKLLPSRVQLYRLRNLRRIFESRFDAKTTQLAKALDMQRDQARGLVAPDRPGGRWLGEDLAREVEKRLGLPEMYLDQADPSNQTLLRIKTESELLQEADQKAVLALIDALRQKNN
jgi:hypothetical protein